MLAAPKLHLSLIPIRTQDQPVEGTLSVCSSLMILEMIRKAGGGVLTTRQYRSGELPGR